MQRIYDVRWSSVQVLDIPSEDDEVLPGVQWGHVGGLFTPAFWKAQLWYADHANTAAYLDYRTGATLRAEISACLLGGHGITAEMAQSAFHALGAHGLLDEHRRVSASSIERILRRPLTIPGRIRAVRYRFPARRAAFLASAFTRLSNERPPAEATKFREWLMTFDGIGWKTASWITRNWMDSNEVAVIDIHVFRAGVIAGLFDGDEASIARRYPLLEARFLRFAHALEVEARRLDVLIWRLMKDSGDLARSHFYQSCKQVAA